MNQVVARLTEAYRTQLSVYERILELAEQAESAARRGVPLSALHAINLEKRAALAEIEAIDGRVESDKTAWRQADRQGVAAGELDELLARLRGVIEAILAREQETDRWVLRAAGLREEQTTT